LTVITIERHQQSEAVGIARSTVLLPAAPVRPADLALMNQIDRLHTISLRRGADVARLLAADGARLPLHVNTLMNRMGIAALYRRSAHDEAEPGHKIYPYLLRGLEISLGRPSLGSGPHIYPRTRLCVCSGAVVLDWFSRRIPSWRVSITMEASSVYRHWKDALASTRQPKSSHG